MTLITWGPEQVMKLAELVSMAALLAIIVLLHRRRPEMRIGSWILGLVATYVADLGWYLTSPDGLPHVIPHTIILEGALLSGLIFSSYSPQSAPRRRSWILYLAANSVAVFCGLLLYGTDTYEVRPYLMVIAAGAVLGVISSLVIRRPWLALLHLVAWGSIAIWPLRGDWRATAYWMLGWVFVAATIHAWRSIPSRTIGRTVVTLSLTLWALSYLLHPWLLTLPLFRQLADTIWGAQKYFVAVGILTLMLEEEVRINSWMAMHDQLTGLPNRRLFAHELKSLLGVEQRKKSVGILVIDLDGFKDVNDVLGHAAGDTLLQEMAVRLQARLGPGETVARLGGDEFAVMVPNVLSDVYMERLSEELKRVIADPFILQDLPAEVRGSIGTAVYADINAKSSAPAEDQLMMIADQRMYAEKVQNGSLRARRSSDEPSRVRVT